MCAELLDLPDDFIKHPPTFPELARYLEARAEFANDNLPPHLSPIEVYGPSNADGRFEMYERMRPAIRN